MYILGNSFSFLCVCVCVCCISTISVHTSQVSSSCLDFGVILILKDMLIWFLYPGSFMLYKLFLYCVLMCFKLGTWKRKDPILLLWVLLAPFMIALWTPIFCSTALQDMVRVAQHFVRGNNPKEFASTLVHFMGKVSVSSLLTWYITNS